MAGHRPAPPLPVNDLQVCGAGLRPASDFGYRLVRTLSLLLAMAVWAPAQSLPEGSGKELVEVICSSCHSTERIAAQHKTKPEWQDKVLEMLQEETDVTQAEKDQIIDYLAKSFPAKIQEKINVNLAAAKDLETALELPAESAAAIVRYREQNGAFKTIDDLKKVPGVDAAKIEAKKDNLQF
jgi:competence protein ComEA